MGDPELRRPPRRPPPSNELGLGTATFDSLCFPQIAYLYFILIGLSAALLNALVDEGVVVRGRLW